MSDLRFKFFAEHTPEALEASVNGFVEKEKINLEDYVDHDYIADGLEKPYNMSLVYRSSKPSWRNRVLGR